MDNKYQISKSKEPQTKQEIIQHQIEELIKRRDKESDLKAKQAINAEITKLFAQYQRLNLWLLEYLSDSVDICFQPVSTGFPRSGD